MKKALLLIVLLFLFVNKIHSQSGKVSTLKFRYSHSLRINNAKVLVKIYHRFKQTKVEVYSANSGEKIDEYKRSKADTIFTLDDKKYKAIVRKLNKLDFNKFVKLRDVAMGVLDGYTCEIEFGDALATVSLKAHSPSHKTDERGLKEYLELCKEIGELAENVGEEVFE